MNGLILVGGRSSRMGTDKSQLAYHNQPQWRYLYELLTPFCQSTFLSCRKDQKENFNDFFCLIDSREIGPLGGISVAFEHNAKESWLVIACDMPFVVQETIEFLVKNRQPSHLATAFLNPDTLLPEPLLTIWEPETYELVKEQLQQHCYSPLQVLKQANAHLLICPEPRWLQNVNTPNDLKNSTKK